MAQGRNTLMDPPIEDLLDKVDSKFTLVALGSARARQVNSYYNSLGEGLGKVVPPQVASVSGKPVSIAFEEIAASKATYTRPDPEEEALAAAMAEAALLAEGEGAGEGGTGEGSSGGSDADAVADIVGTLGGTAPTQDEGSDAS
jgi:DNA-directed RNA polymerase subunit omega